MTATQQTTLEKVGSRLYFRNSPFSAKDRIKRLGGHWDGEERCWWIGTAKRAEAEALVAALNGGITAESAKAAESVDLDPNTTPPGIVADKLDDAGRTKEAEALREPPKEDLSKCRVYAQVEYKGRRYHQIARTGDGSRLRLCTLDTDGPVFWADATECQTVKTYAGREQFGGYHRGTITVYPTIGSLRRFRDRQRDPNARKRVQCHECDAWHDAGETCPECAGG